jgi:hypothetical protein
MQCTTTLCLAISAWLSFHGFAAPQRDAVLRNIHLESRFDPCVTRGKNGKGSAYLLQWLGPRRVALLLYAHTTQCPLWQTQMEFMAMELRAHKYTLFWRTADTSVAFREMRQRFGRGR